MGEGGGRAHEYVLTKAYRKAYEYVFGRDTIPEMPKGGVGRV